MLASPISIAELNALPEAAFVNHLGGIYENSSWIAAGTWVHRPFASVENLQAQFDATLHANGPEAQLALIKAHPDLAGRLARSGALTRESTQEQQSAGLDQLTAAEAAEFDELNTAYLERYGFPFVICARLNDRKSILQAFRRRLTHSRDEEIATALTEIRKIAALRLAQIVHD